MKGHKKVGNYMLKEQIGEGQFSKVYKAYSLEDESKLYAVKVIDKKSID